MATDCNESPRGVQPTQIVTAEFRLRSQSASIPPAGSQRAFQDCLTRMKSETNVVPSWRNGAVVPLTESAPNVFTMQFNAIPVDIANTMTVRDVNECRRNPDGDASVVTGVTINGTFIQRVVPGTRTLTFVLEADGTVLSPPDDGKLTQ
jgi:hypothetical protein